MLKLIEKILDVVIRWILSHRRIKPNSPCPACGARQGGIKYDPTTKRVLCGCDVCSAVWPKMPIVPSQMWDLIGKQIEAQHDYEDTVASLFSEKPSTKKPEAGVN